MTFHLGFQPLEAPPVLPPKDTDVRVEFPFQADGTDVDDDDEYTQGGHDDERIIWKRDFTALPPGPGYTLSSVTETSIERVDPSHDLSDPVGASYKVKDKSTFTIFLDDVNFQREPAIRFAIKLIWNPPDQSTVQQKYQQDLVEYTEAKRREAHAQYVSTVT